MTAWVLGRKIERVVIHIRNELLKGWGDIFLLTLYFHPSKKMFIQYSKTSRLVGSQNYTVHSCHWADLQYVAEHVEGVRASSRVRRNRHQFSTQCGARRDKSGCGLTDGERCRFGNRTHGCECRSTFYGGTPRDEAPVTTHPLCKSSVWR